MKIANKILLITGGTGSFGNAVLQRFLNTDHFSEIRIFSRDEKKQDDMRILLQSDKIKFYIGDVRDYDSIEPATRSVDYIFHAAALKQVPSCEFYPMEAIQTNIHGTSNTIDAAIKKRKKAKRSSIVMTKILDSRNDKQADDSKQSKIGFTMAEVDKLTLSEKKKHAKKLKPPPGFKKNSKPPPPPPGKLKAVPPPPPPNL